MFVQSFIMFKSSNKKSSIKREPSQNSTTSNQRLRPQTRDTGWTSPVLQRKQNMFLTGGSISPYAGLRPASPASQTCNNNAEENISHDQVAHIHIPRTATSDDNASRRKDVHSNKSESTKRSSTKR